MRYKLLGVIVWRGGRWYLRRRVRRSLPSRRIVIGGTAGLAVAGGAVFVARRAFG